MSLGDVRASNYSRNMQPQMHSQAFVSTSGTSAPGSSTTATAIQSQPQSFSKHSNFTYATSGSSGGSLRNNSSAETAARCSLMSNQTPSSTRKVFIQRDYSEGTAVRFQTKFPPELEGYVEWQHFDYLITTLNCYFDKAEGTNSSTFCEGCCACCTAYLVYICLETHYEKYMHKTKAFIDEQNEKIWKPRGLHVSDPLERGLRIIEISIGPRAQQKDFSADQLKRN